MSEVEKQESQKTVVAFITGLLIGGLLVWVFSSTPEEKKEPVDESTNTEEVSGTDTEDTKSDEKSDTKTEVMDKGGDVVVTGTGSIEVADQKAGDSVTLGALSFPTKAGWVVVRDYKDGVVGNILGTARYSADEGLTPKTVDLRRATVAGSTYQVSFYTNEGAIGFVLGEDKLIEKATTETFKAN